MLSRELSAGQAIDQLRLRIREALYRGLDVSEAQKVLELALNAIEREDFDKASARATQAAEVASIETERAFNVWNFAYRYWYALLLAAGLGAVGAYFAYHRALILYIRHRLRALVREQAVLLGEMRELQQAVFVKKALSSLEYYKAMHQYEARLESIKSQMARLRILRARLLSVKAALKYTLEEQDVSRASLRNAQMAYFVDGTLSRRRYFGRAEELKLLLAELDASVLALKARLRK